MPGGTDTVDFGSLAIQSALAETGVTGALQDPRFANLDGSGVTTVVIDTGIDLDHSFFGPDANSDGIADRILFQYDFANGDPDASDIANHGSHVASLIGSQDSAYPGVAPGTDLIALKVFEDSGKGYFSYLEKALQWVVANQEAYHIGVVNLSLGDLGNWTDSISLYGIGDELATLSGMDVIVVAAAGNNYYQYEQPGVAYPAADPAVIAVGATWAADFGGPWRIKTGAIDYTTGVDHIASFSQRDETLLDTFAPGARFNGANAKGGIKTMEGTSQAAAFVSGVAALSQQLAQQELGRDLTTAEFALLLKETSDFIVDGDDEIDNVVNTGLQYPRINFYALAEHILTLGQTPSGGGVPSGGGNGSGSLMEQAAPGVHQMTLTAGQTATGNDFGNFQLGEISGVKFEDVDGDGARDPGESGLAGWTIYLDANSNSALDPGEVSTVTDGTGAYAFTDLGPAVYRVREVSQAGWVHTSPAGETYEITMTSGLSADSRSFGDRAIQAPVNTIPPTQEIAEDTVLVFSTGTANSISVTDVDVGSNPVEVILTAANGELTLGQTTGLVFSAGDGTTDTAMTFRGTLTAINAALEGLQFIPSLNFSGAAALTIYTSDLGNTGGSAKTDTDTVAITVLPVNDAPVNTIPGAQTINENTALVLSGTKRITVSDVDAGANPVQVTLTADQGTATLAGTTGLTFISGDGAADAVMTFTGTLADINTALNNLSFQPLANFNGAAALTIGTSDLGNTGGGAQTDTDTVAITVLSINSAPVNTVPGAQTINEDTTLVFSGTRRITVSDVDAGANPVRVGLAAQGKVTLAGTTGLTFISGDGAADAIMTFTGTLADINTALNNLSFQPLANFNGAAALTIYTNDMGNPGGGLMDTDTVAITVLPVNDAPVNTVPGAQTINEDTTLVFSGTRRITVSDVDAGANPVQVTLTAGQGTATLAGTTGLTFISGDGAADAVMTFTGTLADINTALNNLSFQPLANFNGAAALTIGTSDLGNTGGSAQTDTDTVAITVLSINSAPVNTVPGAQTINEDTTLVFSGAERITVSDVDAGANPLRVGLAARGKVTLASTTGLTFISGDGAADAVMTFTGTLADINTALNNLSFQPLANFSGAAALTIYTNDLGNTGGGLMDTDTVTITVLPVNDAPVNTVPGAQTINEDTALVFSGTRRITVSDVDAGANPVQVTLTAGQGTATLAGTTGLTFSTGDGAADAIMTFTGTLADINTALNNLSFQPLADFNGAAALTIGTGDLGNTGGSAQTDTDTVAITVIPINDAPVTTVPGAQTINEDSTLVFSGAERITVSDVDAGANPMRVTMSAAQGKVTLAGTTGLTFISGDGAADAVMTFTGTLADINTALNNLSFQPLANFSGAAALTIYTNDMGNTGGGPRMDTDTVAITVLPVNNAPVNTVPGAQTITEDTTLVFSGTRRITVSDVDAGTNPVQVTLTADQGTATLAGTTGLTFISGDGAADAVMTFTGMLADINTALNNLSFQPLANFNGAAALTISTSDLGNTGGAAQIDTDTVAITVLSINNAPVNTVPGAQTINEDTTLVFSGAERITVSDVDAGTNPLRVGLAAQGTVTLAGTTGLTFISGDGTADAVMTFTGTLADINTALNNLSFQPLANFSGAAALTIYTNDMGNPGGGPRMDTDTVAITVLPVNDAPVNTVPGAQTINEDTTLVFSGTSRITVSDVDAGANPVQVTLTADQGTATLAGTTGLTFISGDGAADAVMTFTGTLADINTALNNLSFQPLANFNGAATLTIGTSDLGNTGGSAQTDTDTVAITVLPVNDAPVNTVPGAQTINKDTTLVFSGTERITVSDVDAGTNPLRVGLAARGKVTLAGTTGLTFISGDGVADAIMTFTGTLDDINTALNNLSFQPLANFSGAAALTIYTNDMGNTGGGPRMDTDTVVITVTANLLASEEPRTSSGNKSTVTAAALAPIVAQAEALWGQGQTINGATLALDQVEFKIADLPGALLGQAVGNTIVIDTDAGGYGWFIDPTPADNQEFSRRTLTGELFATASSPAFGGMDLLTVVMHEFGHVLGFDHQAQGVMEATLQAGKRLLPTTLSDPDHRTPSAADTAPIRNNAPPDQAPPRLVMVFDEARGELILPGLGLVRPDHDDLKFYPSEWDGREERESGDDWIVDYHPRKLHG